MRSSKKNNDTKGIVEYGRVRTPSEKTKKVESY